MKIILFSTEWIYWIKEQNIYFHLSVLIIITIILYFMFKLWRNTHE